MRIYIIVSFIFLFFNLSCSSFGDGSKLIKDKEFPRWLKDNKQRTNQTSGITYIGVNNDGEKTFLLADDDGEIYRLSIKDNSSLKLSKINLSEQVKKFLRPFPKKDFEEIVYDKFTNEILLSIEGNEPDFKKYLGIYKLIFENGNRFAGSISSIEKLNISPEEKFLEFTANNIGFEGLATDGKYIYAGLETASPNLLFASKAKIFIISKETKKIIKIIDTEELQISTISGLFCPNDLTLLGADRNGKKVFYLKLDKELNVVDNINIPIPTNIPDYPQLDYWASLESITMDSENNIYMVDDPWRLNYVPGEDILSKLDSNTKENFINLIPIIYKFKLDFNPKR